MDTDGHGSKEFWLSVFIRVHPWLNLFHIPGMSPPKGKPGGSFILPNFLPIMPPEKLFIIFRAWEYCFNNAFTSCTDVPLPLAMRRRRLPLMIMWLSRSCGVIESMIATT